MARLPMLNADNDQWGTILNEFLRVAHNEDGTLKLEEVDATTIGVVANDAKAAQSNSAVINNFFANPQVSPAKLVLPAGTVFVDDTINLLNRNSIVLRGKGILATILRKITDGYLIKLAGSFNYIGDMTLDGSNKVALCGLYVKGSPQSEVSDTTSTHLNTFRNLYIQQFRVGIRVGHFSALDDDPGDNQHPDIIANLWQNIFLDYNRYGLVRDGHNIVNDHFENFLCQNTNCYHVYLPVGGDFRCFTAQFGATFESEAYPKIYSAGGGAIILVNARSENGEKNPQPPFLRVINAPTFVELHEVVVTNDLKDEARRSNLAIDLQGCRATLTNCEVWGTIKLVKTQYVGLNNQVGKYDKADTVENNTIILDALIEEEPPTGQPRTYSNLEVGELTIKRIPQAAPRLHFGTSPHINSDDGAFYLLPTGGDTELGLNLFPSGEKIRSAIILYQKPFVDPPSPQSPQSRVMLENSAGNARILIEGINGGAARGFEINIGGQTVFVATGDPGTAAIVARTTAPDLNGVGLLVAGRLGVQGKSIGKATIPMGATQLLVPTPAATDTSTILLTLLSDPMGVSLWISAWVTGSFTISANQPLAAPIDVQYLIIN